MSSFAIGDVHGCLLTLRCLVEEKIGLAKTDHVVFLGDYIDRGPDSKGVLDYLHQLSLDGHHTTVLRGNHDDLLVRGRLDASQELHHLQSGAIQTLMSFRCDSHAEIPVEYCDYIDTMEMYYEEDKSICVHASFNSHHSTPHLDFNALMWLRLESDISETKNKRLVCGHTPTTIDNMKQRIDSDKK
ncbi:MAG: serine/threonine protein phosphatase [Ignavibacteria bacterium]|nr:serine/threonine protein phosphatase [Ignavibacteria bacterium]